LPLWIASTAAAEQAYEAVEPHMGTLVRIKLYARNEAQAQRAFRTAFERVAQLDFLLSDYKPDSELNRICRTAVGRPAHVSEDLFRVVEAGQELAAETGGTFDITVGPLTHLWRNARKKHCVPDSSVLQAAAARCGYRKLHLDASQRTIEFDSPDMQLDAGGIAKGYAADQALIVLSKLGIRSALVAVSGDLAFGEAPPGESGWKIGIDASDEAGAPLTRVLLLANAAVSTSGSREQHLDANGKRFSHIVDPRTGMGLTTDIIVTVVARHGIDADPAATAISVLGREQGLKFVERRHDLAALIVTRHDGRSECVESSKFHAKLR
jgi:FAD:protein FMN transferase